MLHEMDEGVLLGDARGRLWQEDRGGVPGLLLSFVLSASPFTHRPLAHFKLHLACGMGGDNTNMFSPIDSRINIASEHRAFLYPCIVI